MSEKDKKDIMAVICDGIDGECVVATRDDFTDKHIMIRQKVGMHKLTATNLRGELVEEAGNGWTDMQTLVILDLSKENLEKALKQSYKIPKELLEQKWRSKFGQEPSL